MCYAAPGIIYLFDRMGVTFNRTPEGLLEFRRFGGTLHHRTAFAGATTGQQLLYALDEQVRRHEAAGVVKKYEGWEFVGLARDDHGRCVGLVALDLRSMKPQAFAAGAGATAAGVVKKYEGWEFVGLARDDHGRCVGLVALDLRSMKPQAFAAGAVVMAT